MTRKTVVTKLNIISWLLLFCINLFFSVWASTQDYAPIYTYNLLLDMLCLTICEFLLATYIAKRGFDIFDPIFFVSAIYLVMFFVTPIYDIITKNYYWFGYSLFEHGLKASAIAFAGYLAMYMFYCADFKKRKRPASQTCDCHTEHRPSALSKDRKKILPLIYVMYVVAFAANVYYLVNSGFGNLIYILTLGLRGTGGLEEAANNIGFISMLSYSLPAIVLLIWEYSDRKLVKAVLFVPMFLLQVTRGFRFFIVQIVITFVVYSYLKKKKRPQLKKLLIVFAIMLVFLLIMTMFRESIRGGSGVDLTQINGEAVSEALDAAIWDNLRIYQNVYGMVKAIPAQYDFVGIRQIVIGTLIMTIPRAIWPGKISSYGGEGLRVLIGKKIAAGQAYPTLGEYYYAFGIFGVVFFMAVFGTWLKKLREKYMHSTNPLDMMYFAVMLGCCLQLIIRGYFPSNFWYLVFAILPIWIVKFVRSVKWEWRV